MMLLTSASTAVTAPDETSESATHAMAEAEMLAHRPIALSRFREPALFRSSTVAFLHHTLRAFRRTQVSLQADRRRFHCIFVLLPHM